MIKIYFETRDGLEKQQNKDDHLLVCGNWHFDLILEGDLYMNHRNVDNILSKKFKPPSLYILIYTSARAIGLGSFPHV